MKTLVAVAILASVGAGCSRSGSLSGDIFVTMRSGDVKRGADVAVTMVRDTPAFRAAWDTLREEYAVEYSEARQRADKFRSVAQDLGRLSDAHDVVRAYERRAEALVREQAALVRVRSDVNGRYAFTDVPVGKYVLYATHEVFDNVAHWFLPVEITTAVQRLDLSNSNSGWDFSREPPRRYVPPKVTAPPTPPASRPAPPTTATPAPMIAPSMSSWPSSPGGKTKEAECVTTKEADGAEVTRCSAGR